jgi:predicted PurR-regulated permease PerM
VGRFDQVKANIRRAYEAGRATARARRNGEEEQPLNGPVGHPVDPPRVAQLHHSTVSRDDALVPSALRIAAAWAWRVIVLIVVLVGALWLIGQISLVVVPLAIALLLAALLSPAVARLRRAHLPRSLATTIVVIGGLASVVATLTLVINQFIDGLPSLIKNAQDGLNQIQGWLKHDLHLTDIQLSNAVSQLQDLVNANKSNLTSGVIHTATTALEILSGVFLMLFALFFFLRDGRTIWRFFVGLLPHAARDPLDRAGLAAWRSLVSYVRATVLVAFIDAVGIGIALALIIPGPLVLPLAALVFLTAFIPIVGATLSGAVAVLVALVTPPSGPFKALLVLAAVIAVQQIEGHLLQPLIMGRAVAIHPLAVIVSIAAGFILGGIVGALVAVPLVAMLNTGIRVLAGSPPDEVTEPVEAAEATP